VHKQAGIFKIKIPTHPKLKVEDLGTREEAVPSEVKKLFRDFSTR